MTIASLSLAVNSLDVTTDSSVLRFKHTQPGLPVQSGTKLRVLCVGDSITVGFDSEQDGGDGNGYRLELRNDLSRTLMNGLLRILDALTLY